MIDQTGLVVQIGGHVGVAGRAYVPQMIPPACVPRISNEELRILLFVCTAGLVSSFLIGCGGGSSSNPSSTSPVTIASSGANVAPISVNGGPDGNYVDGAFASVTLCMPGMSTCQTIDGMLVDTGSSA